MTRRTAITLLNRAPVLPLLIATAACAREAEPAELNADARVRIVSERLGPGWHDGMVGAAGSCVVVMVPQPLPGPVRLRPIRLDDISQLQVSRRYDGTGSPPRLWTPGADTTGEGWRPIAIQALRARYSGCPR
jgi:hypothetical protein